jgi:hypothetical protein
MGFLDKAKKMAEQAQAKLDEAQKQFNEGQQRGQPSGPAVEYDQHGRPIPQEPPATAAPPHGDPLAPQSAEPPPATAAPPQRDPLAPQSAEPPPATAAPTPGVPPTGQGDPITSPPQAEPAAPPPPGVPPTGEQQAPQAPPAQPQADEPAEDRNHPSYAPPKLSGGDPLAG